MLYSSYNTDIGNSVYGMLTTGGQLFGYPCAFRQIIGRSFLHSNGRAGVWVVLCVQAFIRSGWWAERQVGGQAGGRKSGWADRQVLGQAGGRTVG